MANQQFLKARGASSFSAQGDAHQLFRLRLFAASALAFFALYTALPLQAQISTVVGTITYRDGRPATNVLVLISGHFRYTDMIGRYKIDGIPQGRQHMVVRNGGTILWQGDVNISGGITTVNQSVP